MTIAEVWTAQWQTTQRLKQAISQVIIGQEQVVEEVIIAMLAKGHVLLEGVPGLGKTLLIRTIADCLDLSFSRIQFTPDLMPADIIGTQIITPTEAGGHAFEFQAGPLFGNLVLADEINRSTPKTQSALLEAMQEETVTVANQTRVLPNPFFVLATQNPLESEGTYLLPEAQLDRFLLKVVVKFPSAAELKKIVMQTTMYVNQQAEIVASGAQLLKIQQTVTNILVADELIDEAVHLLLSTHPDHKTAPETVRQYVRAGVGPRGLQALIRAAKAKAFLAERYNVSRDDIAAVLPAVFRHRILCNFEAVASNVSTDQIIDELLMTWREGGS